MKNEKQRNERTGKETANWNGKLIEHIRDEALRSDNDFFVQINFVKSRSQPYRNASRIPFNLHIVFRK